LGSSRLSAIDENRIYGFSRQCSVISSAQSKQETEN
jgi:hypothetical protein